MKMTKEIQPIKNMRARFHMLNSYLRAVLESKQSDTFTTPFLMVTLKKSHLKVTRQHQQRNLENSNKFSPAPLIKPQLKLMDLEPSGEWGVDHKGFVATTQESYNRAAQNALSFYEDHQFRTNINGNIGNKYPKQTHVELAKLVTKAEQAQSRTKQAEAINDFLMNFSTLDGTTTNIKLASETTTDIAKLAFEDIITIKNWLTRLSEINWTHFSIGAKITTALLIAALLEFSAVACQSATANLEQLVNTGETMDPPEPEHPGEIAVAPTEESNPDDDEAIAAQALSTQDIIDLAAEKGITLTPEAAAKFEEVVGSTPNKRILYRIDSNNSAQIITVNNNNIDLLIVPNVSFVQITDDDTVTFTDDHEAVLATATITSTQASIKLTPESFAAPTPVDEIMDVEPEEPKTPEAPIGNTDSEIELIPGNKIIEILRETNQLELEIAVNLLTDIRNPVVVSVLQTDGSYKLERVTLDNSSFYITDQGRITARTEYTEIGINDTVENIESTWLPTIGDWASRQRSFNDSNLLTVWVANSSIKSEGIITNALNINPSNLCSITPITGQEFLSLIESKSDTVVSVANMAALEKIFEDKKFVLPTSFPLLNNQTINSDSINAIEVAENEYYIFFTTLINKGAPTSEQVKAVINYHKGRATPTQITILENMSNNFINGEPLQATIETESGPEVVKLNGIEVIFNHSETQGRLLDTAAAESLINIPAYPIEKNQNGGLTVLYTSINHNNAGYTSSRQLTEELGKYGYEVKFDAYLSLSTIMFEETNGTIYIYRGGSLPHTE